jgi:hypothetical protein
MNGFKIPCPLAVEAVDTATKLLAWCNEASNRRKYTSFANSLALYSKFEDMFNYRGILSINQPCY